MAVVEVVKYSGSPEVLAWKYPNDELGTWTQLIVAESQGALLFKGGQALDLFGPGRHTLETANIPFLNNIINIPFGGTSPFSAEIWFINKAYNLDVKWGTMTPIQLQDPKYNVFIPVRSHGQFGIQIDDARKFLVKLVGVLPRFGEQELQEYFKGLYLMRAKDAISSYVIKKKISFLEINAYLADLSEALKEAISPMLDEYGIKLVSFFVNDISVPETDPAVIKLKEALAKRAEMDIVGYDYTQERSFDTLEGAASNAGSGGSTQSDLMGAGIGLAMGLGVGGAFGNQMGGIAGVINPEGKKDCPKCGGKVSLSSRFCDRCGYEFSEDGKTLKKQVTCSSCGKPFLNDAKFCPECGEVYNPCPQCGADIPEGASVCKECGTHAPIACPQCGLHISYDAKFCPECGKSIARECSNCKAVVKGNAKFCPECGTEMGDE